MFCVNCGSNLTGQFCATCGHRCNVPPVQAPPPQQQVQQQPFVAPPVIEQPPMQNFGGVPPASAFGSVPPVQSQTNQFGSIPTMDQAASMGVFGGVDMGDLEDVVDNTPVDPNAKSRGTAFNLAIWAGMFGAHNLYLGRKKLGIIQLALGIFGILLAIAGLIVALVSPVTIWSGGGSGGGGGENWWPEIGGGSRLMNVTARFGTWVTNPVWLVGWIVFGIGCAIIAAIEVWGTIEGFAISGGRVNECGKGLQLRD